MKLLSSLSILLLAGAACGAQDGSPAPKTPDDAASAPATTDNAKDKAQAAKPDNTAKNARDRDDDAVTASGQKVDESDRKIIQTIRRAVTKDDTISTNGHNVKIMAMNGKVTLRGPVKDEKEKTAIADLAKQVSGVTDVDNQLEPVPAK